MEDPADVLDIPAEPAQGSAPEGDAPSQEPAEGGEQPSEGDAVPSEPSGTPAEATYDVSGRQLTGEQLREEYTKLQADHTVKSQELAKINKSQAPPETPQYEWQKPDWQPKSYAEILEANEQKAELKQQRIDAQTVEDKRLNDEVIDAQLTEIRKIEPNLSEDLLFQRATKLGSKDLMAVFKDMQDQKLAIKMTEQKIVKNIQQRGTDPVDPKGGGADTSEGIDYHGYGEESPQEMLVRLKG
jgi:hypothetical protein|tara:strand:+ start:6000 stop:6725 length:726 start_codon:yes stop_codon:yes gene_type:complete